MHPNKRKTHCPKGHPYDAENTAYHRGSRYCRTCHRKYGRDWARRRRAEDREAINAYQQTWREANPETIERYRVANARYTRQYRYLKEYGLTMRQRAELFEESDGLCALCYEKPAEAVDHDHDTGKVRGAVCHSCNWGLGNFNDDPVKVERALDYLRNTR
jgi:hypothetical protein